MGERAPRALTAGENPRSRSNSPLGRLRLAAPGQNRWIEAYLQQAEQAQVARERWLAEHPVESAWQADIVERVNRRRSELGCAAEERLPEHVVRLIGRPGAGTDDRDEWRQRAGRIEAYREQWRVEPGMLAREYDLWGEQALAWQRVESSLQVDAVDELIGRLPSPPARNLALGVEL